MQIVLARLEVGQEIVKLGRVDVGEMHKFRTIQKPVAVMWLNNGTKADEAKAKVFAEREGYKVFCYKQEKNPLGKARSDVAT